MSDTTDKFIHEILNPAIEKMYSDMQDAIKTGKSFPDDYIENGALIGNELKKVSITYNEHFHTPIKELNVLVSPCLPENTADCQDFYSPLTDDECRYIAKENPDDYSEGLSGIAVQRNDTNFGTEDEGQDYASEFNDAGVHLGYNICLYILRDLGVECENFYDSKEALNNVLKEKQLFNDDVSSIVFWLGRDKVDFDLSHLLDSDALARIEQYKKELNYSEVKDMKKNDPITKFRKDFSDYVENSGIASEYAFRETYDSQRANDPHKFAYSCIFSFGSGFEHEISFTDVQDLTSKLVASLPESVDSMLADSESMPLNSLPKEHQKATLELFKEIEGVKKFLQSYKEELSQEITDTVSSEKEKINSNTVWSMLLDYDITKTDTQISQEGDDYKVVQKVSLSDDRNKNSIELEREIRYMLEKSSADPDFPDYELKRTDLKDSSKRSAFHICIDGQKTDDQDYKDVLDIIEDIAYQGAATDDERKIERMILDMVDQEPKIEQKISSEYGIVNDPDFSMQFNDLFLFSKEEKLSHAESFIEENNPFPNVNELFKYDEIQKKKPLSQYCEECLKAYGDNFNDQEMKLIADHMKANYTLAVMITDAAVTDLGIEQNDPKLTLNHDSYKEMLSEIKQKGESFSCEDAHELAAKYAASLNYGGKSIKSYKELNSNSLTM
ncbi:hypothetical protein [Succinivibrio dextrinosolvens]|uniref:hypothetical protein n=1 Tax=Succinivibrio dextrinosolvens TaxID=83771 RepID=UPI00241DE491|nr:hypothetical protein [Succinivibrio dextrinosolvens]MBE6422618.1 hypothetical protein [Succinivibrio dextrinosolvens]